jgi:rubrerythrin
MTSTKAEIIKHLNAALELERKGQLMYKMLSKKAMGFYTKTIFIKLAEEENKHFDFIKKVIDKVESQKIETSNLLYEVTTKLKPISSEEVFSKGRAAKKAAKSSIEALNYALEAEEQSYYFYLELSQKTNNTILEKVFLMLSEYEKKHMEIINKTVLFFRKANKSNRGLRND